jgi:integrase/recombinase XerD
MAEQAISPLRRRMIEDMTIRKFAQKSQHDAAGLLDLMGL